MTLTKGVAGRRHSADFVRNLGRDHVPTIVAGIGGRLGEPAAKSAIGVLEPALGDMDRDAADMVAAEDAYAAAISDDPRHRSDRNSLHERLEDHLLGFRSVVEGGMGEEGVRAFGFDGRTANTAEDVCRHCEFLLEKGVEIAAAHPTASWNPIDVAGFLEEIRPDTLGLRRHLGLVATDVREAKDLLDVKNAAIAKHDETFRAVASTLESFLLLAGQPGLAKRVRPSSRRAGRTDVTPPENAEDVPPADAPTEDVA